MIPGQVAAPPPGRVLFHLLTAGLMTTEKFGYQLPLSSTGFRVASPALGVAIRLRLGNHPVDTVHRIDGFTRRFGTV